MTLERHMGGQLLHFGFYSISNVKLLAFILHVMRTHWRLLSSGVISTDFLFLVYLPSYEGVHWGDLAWERWIESYDLEGLPGISLIIPGSL